MNKPCPPCRPAQIEHPFFAGFVDEELEVISRIARPLVFDEGETIFEQGEPAGSVLFLSSGRVRVAARLPGGSEVDLAEVASGQVLGELGLLAGHRRSATARALTPIAALAIDSVDLHSLCANHGRAPLRLMQRLSRLVAKRLRDTREEAAYRLAPGMRIPGRADIADALSPGSDFDYRPFLPGLDFFAGFSGPDIGGFDDCCEVFTAPRGCVIRRPDESCEHLFVVVRGAVQTTILLQGRTARTAVLGPGRAFGEIDWLLGPVPGSGAASLSRATLLRLPKSAGEALSDPCSRLAFRFQASFLRGLLSKLDAQARDYTRSKLARLISA